MCEVSLSQAELQFPTLIKKLQTGEESIVYITDDGQPIAQITLTHNFAKPKNVAGHHTKPRKLGTGKGKFEMPKDFDKWDKDIEEMFGDSI